MNIPQTGVNLQKAKFFSEAAQAFEFLAICHSLSADKQLELMQFLTQLKASVK